MIKLDDKMIIDYGKSMYGGWFATVHQGGQYKGIGGNTLHELCLKLGVSLTALRRDVERRDSIM